MKTPKSNRGYAPINWENPPHPEEALYEPFNDDDFHVVMDDDCEGPSLFIHLAERDNPKAGLVVAINEGEGKTAQMIISGFDALHTAKYLRGYRVYCEELAERERLQSAIATAVFTALDDGGGVPADKLDLVNKAMDAAFAAAYK